MSQLELEETMNTLQLLANHQSLTLVVSTILIILLASAIANLNYKVIKSFCISSTNSMANLILHLSGVIWASSVSIYNKELQAQILTQTSPIDSTGATFLLANSIAIILMTSRYRGDKLKQELEKSLPPTAVLEGGANLHIDNLKLFENVAGLISELKYKKLLLSRADFDQHKQHATKISSSHIVPVIESIANIANEWTKQRHGNIDYSVNVFSVLDISDYVSEPDLDKALVNSPFFLFTDSLQSRLSFCDQLLISQQQFSTCKKAVQGEPLIFPYSVLGQSKKHHPNFEGAPTSIEKNEARYVPDTKIIAEKFFNRIESTYHGDYLTNKYKEEIRLYYKNDNTRSFLAIPIYDRSDKVIAVVNVYSKTKNMLSSEDRAKAFYHFIRPHLNVVSYLINSQITISEM
ncbi:GAF domain-containing protein [Vibrio apostichopi]|uniref:GAF domain-containing protein n=1 Tax=Vibrio apostichopi TaxID=3035453 RepID=UPI0025727D79|nr:GAF domain-containing protein [Vibrio sp. FE10]